MTFKEWLVIITLGIGWGMSFVFNAILLRELGPVTVSLGRVTLGAIGCWVYVILARKTVPLTPRLALEMLGFGAISFALPFAIYALGQQSIAAGVAGIINAMTPVMVVLISHVWRGGERATKAKSLGVAFGFFGIVILALPVLQRGESSAFLAILITIGAPICYGISSNWARRYKGINPAVLAAMGLTGASILIAPLAIWHDGWPVITRAETWGALAMIGFVLTSASFIAFYWVLPRVGATNTSTVTFIAPVSAVLMGVYLLGEQFRLEHALGMGAIFCGLLMIDGRVMRLLRRDKGQQKQGA